MWSHLSMASSTSRKHPEVIKASSAPGPFLAGIDARCPSAADPYVRRVGAVTDLVAVHVLIHRPEGHVIIGIGRHADVLTPVGIGFVLSAGPAIAQNRHRRALGSVAPDGYKIR